MPVLNEIEATMESSDITSSTLHTSETIDASSELSSIQAGEEDVSSEAGGTRRSSRSSGRMRAKPALFDASPAISIEKFIEIATSPMKQQFKSYPMRKRQQKESEEVDDTGVFKKPGPVAKRSTKSPLTITIKKGKGGSAKKTGISAHSQISVLDKSLFTIVLDGKSAMVSVINDWIESYNTDKTEAMAELIQFFVQSSGCNAKVTKPMIDAEDTVQAIRHLTENFGEEAEEYPLIITRPDYKKFKGNFVSFILQLINLCQHSIIYDEEMMDILICWIIGLSDSQVRAFRHTSTVAGMKIVSGLIEVAIKVNNELDNLGRQLDLEEQKGPKQKSREKIEKLSRKKDELHHNKGELEDMVNRIFSGIFIHRYRDVRPEIRSVCIYEMGCWMNSYSSYFLDQNYLKYFGWTLYDKVGEVRLGVLKALEKLYLNEDFLEHLELFTARFKDRLIHMTLDVDTEVAVQAIKIAALLYKYDALEEDDCSQVEQLVFCDQRRMAHAAGEFLALRIIRLSIEASPQKMLKGRKEDYLRQMNIKAILDFFIKTEIHDHCAYIIDSLWEHTNLLKDWKTMTNLLLDSDSLIELEDVEESALIDLMCCAVKQAATGTAPPGRSINRKLSQKDKKQHFDDKDHISAHFMEHLPALVEKYKADVTKTRDLLSIPQYFNLDMYPEKRLTKHLDVLLAHMEDVVMKHSDADLLEVVSQTYYYLIDNELVIQQTVEVSRNRLVDEIVEKFKTTIADGILTADEDRDGQAHYNFLTSLKRINYFYRNHDLSDWSVFDDINAIIEQGVNGSVDDEVLVLAAHITHMSLLMSLASLDLEKEIDKSELKTIRRRQKKFVKHMEELLQFGSMHVKTEVFKILCDFFIYFAKQLLNKAPQLAPIVCEADASLQVLMRDFIITHVFNTISEDEEMDDEEDDSKAQELYNKRTLLSGLCKLIGYRMFDMKLAAPIYAQFLRAYADYSDIIKQLMQKAKEGDIIVFSKVLLFALQQAFESIREDNDGKIEPKSPEFNAIKDLARRFALMLGVNINQDNTRKSTITMHREGIVYAFSYPADMTSPEKELPEVPPNLLFLDILHEFTYRLIKVDRKVVMAHLEKTAGNMLNKKGQAWSTVRLYKNGISSGSNTSKNLSANADDLLEAEMAAEIKAKKRGVSLGNTTRKVAGAKKKLSMSAADDFRSKKTAPKIAKSIPTRKSNRAAAQTMLTYEDFPEEPEENSEDDSEQSEEIEDEDNTIIAEQDDDGEEEEEEVDDDDDGEGLKLTITRTSPQSYCVASPSKNASPRKQYSSRSQGSSGELITHISTVSPKRRGRPPKSGSMATTPVKIQQKRKHEDDSDDEYESGNESGLSTPTKSGSKKPRKSYIMRSNTPHKLAEKMYYESLENTYMYSNSGKSREERAARRKTREEEADEAAPHSEALVQEQDQALSL